MELIFNLGGTPPAHHQAQQQPVIRCNYFKILLPLESCTIEFIYLQIGSSWNGKFPATSARSSFFSFLYFGKRMYLLNSVFTRLSKLKRRTKLLSRVFEEKNMKFKGSQNQKYNFCTRLTRQEQKVNRNTPRRRNPAVVKTREISSRVWTGWMTSYESQKESASTDAKIISSRDSF